VSPLGLDLTLNNSYVCCVVLALFIAVWPPEIPRFTTGLTALQNRYFPVVFLVWVNFTIFHYEKPVSSYPRCRFDAMFMRRAVVVCFHFVYPIPVLTPFNNSTVANTPSGYRSFIQLPLPFSLKR